MLFAGFYQHVFGEKDPSIMGKIPNMVHFHLKVVAGAHNFCFQSLAWTHSSIYIPDLLTPYSWAWSFSSTNPIFYKFLKPFTKHDYFLPLKLSLLVFGIPYLCRYVRSTLLNVWRSRTWCFNLGELLVHLSLMALDVLICLWLGFDFLLLYFWKALSDFILW